MKKTLIAFSAVLFLFPSVSSAASLSFSQSESILMVLQAFGTDQKIIDTVRSILEPESVKGGITTTQVSVGTTTQNWIVTAQPTQQNIQPTTTTLFGSTGASISTITQNNQTPPMPDYDLSIIQVQNPQFINGGAAFNNPQRISLTNDEITISKSTDLSPSLIFYVELYDSKGEKVPVTVTTDDPDMPSSFVINATTDEQNSAMASGNYFVAAQQKFCVATIPDNYHLANGCPVLTPTTTGTFFFTFTAGNSSRTIKATINS